MKILESKFVKGFIKMADDGYQQGWHERNGGNLSYRLNQAATERTGRMGRNWCGSSGAGRRIFPCDRKRKIFPKHHRRPGSMSGNHRTG